MSETKQEKLKTPISYYGGKQMMANHILPLIPQHRTYVEPFFGGGAIFWLKPPSEYEVVNDISSRLITFYKVLKYDFDKLKILVDETFHSREQHNDAKVEYKDGKDEIADMLKMAWAVWVQTNMSFANKIEAGFGYDLLGKCALKIHNKKRALIEAHQERMRKVTIENYDVLKVMKAYDSEDAFFYLDPPYVSANQGHYAGYTEEQFIELLDACVNLKGKFLLSSYPEDCLLKYREKYGWKTNDIVKTISVSGKRPENKLKTECLTWNY